MSCLFRLKNWGHNKILDSGFRRNDVSASFVIPGKAAGRDPESRPFSETAALKKLLCSLKNHFP
jgi:hypothetical protein